MGVGGKRKVGDYGSQVEHSGKLDAEFTGRVNGHAELEGFAHASGFDAWTDASPERGVEKDDIHGRVEDVGGKLFETHDDGVGSEWDADHLSGAPHAVEAEDRVFKVVVAQVPQSLVRNEWPVRSTRRR